MRDVTNDTPVGRALALIAPSADREQQCRQFIVYFIGSIADSKPPVPGTRKKAQLSAAAAASQRALEAIKKVPELKCYLFPKRSELDVTIFLAQLECVALNAKWQSVSLTVPRSGGRPNYRKQAAAGCAFALLLEFNRKRPALTTGGPFFELASVLYEAVTGKPSIDLSSQCRAVHNRYLPRRAAAEQRRK